VNRKALQSGACSCKTWWESCPAQGWSEAYFWARRAKVRISLPSVAQSNFLNQI
jgi:hypothetical protein